MRIAEINCPSCGAPCEFAMHTSIDVSNDSSLKVRVLDGSLFRSTGSICSHVAEVEHPAIYRDDRRRILIWLFPINKGAVKPDVLAPMMSDIDIHAYQRRRVGSLNELIEKILLFDDGLDDLVIELVKRDLRSQIPSSDRSIAIFYRGRGRDNTESPEEIELNAVGPRGIEPYCLSIDQYEELGELYRDIAEKVKLSQDGWHCVDQTLADSVEHRR